MERDLCSLTFPTTLIQSKLIDEICWNKSAWNNFPSAFRLMWSVHRLLLFCYLRQLIACYFYRSTEIIYDYTREVNLRRKKRYTLWAMFSSFFSILRWKVFTLILFRTNQLGNQSGQFFFVLQLHQLNIKTHKMRVNAEHIKNLWINLKEKVYQTFNRARDFFCVVLYWRWILLQGIVILCDEFM